MDPKVRYFLDEALTALPEKLDLVYVDYNDRLSDDQVKSLLAGDQESLWDSTSEWESEQQHYHMRHLLFEECGLDDDEAQAVFDDDEAWEEFRETCYERDQSDWLDQLVRNTPNVQIRYDLDHEVPDYTMVEDLAEEAQAIAEAAGIDYETNSIALRSLVANASYGGILCVLHNSDLADVLKVDNWGRPNGGKVIFTDPYLLVYDGLNGSGHDEQVCGTIEIEIKEDTMRHDAGRYSWSDDIAGVVHGAYQTHAEFIPSSEEPNDA